jgi:hypothetical protein
MITINLLKLFEEIIAVCTDNYTKLTNNLCGQNSELLIIETGGIYSYH